MVDLGWHNMILHTKVYAEFCEDLLGQFIHHHPYDGGQNDPMILARTKALIADGYTIDAPCGSHARP